MAKAPAKKKETENTLPDAQEQELLLAGTRSFAANPRFAGARRAMQALSASPPQGLLLEGGTAEERLHASLYWAALLNCQPPKQSRPEPKAPSLFDSLPTAAASDSPSAPSEEHLPQDGPCLACPVCIRFVSRMHRDMFFFNGAEGSIKIDDVREMRAILGEPPREAKSRMVIFHEGQALGEAAANSLLKSLEEPKPGTAFVLAAPQRERLLQTLVSRSWVLTLPWPGPLNFLESANDSAAVVEWCSALLNFAHGAPDEPAASRTPGRGWMDRTSRRGNLDAALAMKIVLFCQAALLQALTDNFDKDAPSELDTPMSRAFAALAPASKRILNEILAECQESLNFNVNTALIMDWLATRMFFVFAGDSKR